MPHGLLPIGSTVKGKPAADMLGLLPFGSMATDGTHDLSTLAGRLLFAIREAGTTPTATERACLTRGYMSRILSGERQSLGSERIEKLSAFLRVSHRWLNTGEGEMVEGVPESPREEGATIARRLGALPEAVAYVLERDAGVERDARGWMEACLVESDARRRSAAAWRPVKEQQAKIRKHKRELQRAKDAPARTPSVGPAKATG